MGRLIDLIGQEFGKLVVVSAWGRDDDGGVTWICLCACGEYAVVRGSLLRKDETKSCGCWLRERLIIHGQTKEGNISSVYGIWVSMKQRCNNPKDKGFKNYGGRGIKVCKRWGKFANFFSDMGEKPKNLSIERIDNSKGYSPDNCKWATRTAQARNSRQNHTIEYQGKTMCISEWAEELGVNCSTLRGRLKRHSPQTAFNM